jgi:hypothetical protein
MCEQEGVQLATKIQKTKNLMGCSITGPTDFVIAQ